MQGKGMRMSTIHAYDFETIHSYRMQKKPLGWRKIAKLIPTKPSHTAVMRWYNNRLDVRNKTPEEIELLLDKRRKIPDQKKRL